MNKVWLITNASGSFFIKLINRLLAGGDKVIATFRYLDVLIDNIDFESDYFLPLEMDSSSLQSVSDTVKLSIAKFGKIDFLITNGIYGKLGFIEEFSNKIVKEEIENNVLGTLNIIRVVLPHLRDQNSGHIFNFSSISGFVSGPRSGIHSASMFSVSAISETLYYELKPFEIHVTNVMQGFFQSENTQVKYIYPEYSYENFVKKFHKKKNYAHFKEESNLSRGVRNIINVSEMADPPLYLFIGGNADKLARAKIRRIIDDMEKANVS